MRPEHSKPFVLLAAVLTATVAAGEPAAANPRGELVGGQMFQSINGSLCYAARGASTYRRSIAGSKAVITFPELAAKTLANPTVAYDLSGAARLFFSSPGAGVVNFADLTGLPDSYAKVGFRAYSETYDTAKARLVVTFTLLLPDCPLAIRAVYDNP